jgi:putative transcriptional regulator
MVRAVVAALTLLLIAAAPRDADRKLEGQLLVASPEMGDPRFARSVILVVRHDKNGAFGLIVNRPLDERDYADLLGSADDVHGKLRVHFGGPVELELGFVLHSLDYRRAETLEIDGRFGMTMSREILVDMAQRKGPAKSLFAFGYAGWGPGQLEAELARGDWFMAPADARLIFDDDRARLWDEAMARRTRDL